jgi:hypothetical protein
MRIPTVCPYIFMYTYDFKHLIHFIYVYENTYKLMKIDVLRSTYVRDKIIPWCLLMKIPTVCPKVF